MKYSAVIPAGGTSSRFGTENKLFQNLNGKPVFIHAVLPFRKFTDDKNIVIPVHKDHYNRLNELLEEYLPGNRIQTVYGGRDRTRSVLNALEAISPDCDLTAVHDAARPLIREKTIRAVYAAAEIHSAAAAARPVTSTLKAVDENGFLSSGDLRREKIYEIETPQTFRRTLLLTALRKAVENDLSFTDDAAAVEACYGLKTYPVNPEEINLKITNFSDIELVEAIIKSRSE